ncbi:MAG: pentapeptide repeat-containing protein [Acaryochloris sp. CRU_2_0]|nr:pentapeptide repeat-containing protein [Acaryochloris sp. CRU_2_0]
MDKANLHSTNFLGAILDNSSLIEANLRRTLMQRTSLRRANLTQAQLKGHQPRLRQLRVCKPV